MRFFSFVIIVVGLFFVVSSVSGAYNVGSNFDEFNEMNVTLVIEDDKGSVSETDAIPAGIFILAMVLGPLKFFFLGSMFGVASKRALRRYDWI